MSLPDLVERPSREEIAEAVHAAMLSQRHIHAANQGCEGCERRVVRRIEWLLDQQGRRV